MESFCGGDPFWNTSLTWGDKNTYPEFTDCFQNTVLLWIPAGWLILTAPFYLSYLCTCHSDVLPSTWKNLSKMCLTVLQLILVVIVFAYVSSELNRTGKTYWQASFLGPVVETVALLLVLLYLELERRKGFITSGVLFVYWVLANIIYIVPFYTKLEKQTYKTDVLDFWVFNIYYALAVLQLVLSCIAETLPLPQGKPPCPEIRASFLSRITFNWINKLIVQGYKKGLTEDDMFLLNPRDQSTTVLPGFELQWRKEELKQLQQRQKAEINRVYVEAPAHHELSESTPLLSSSPGQPSGERGETTAKDSKIRVSIWKVLFKAFGWDLFISNIWKLFYDILVFVNPILLRYLIDFASDLTQQVWKGYVYCAGFIVVLVLQSFSFHQLMYQTCALGIRLRAALIGAIYKKSMKMNNQSRTESTVGEIVNLMSVDAEHIQMITGYIWGVWSSPLQIILALVFLYYTVGYSMFAGLGVMVILLPINMVIMSKVHTLQEKQMAQKDKRIKLMTEILNGIKILKLYAWELAFGEKITEIRTVELKLLRKAAIINAFMTFSWTVAPFSVGLATFATYIFVNEDHLLDAQTAFVAISLFNILRFALNIAPIVIMETVKASVSIKRMNKFLNHDDLDVTSVTHNPSDDAVSVDNGTFSWDPKLGPCLKNINVTIQKGSLVAVVGTVGAGKSSLVSAILGEMEKITGQVNVDGTTAYVPQQAWIQNASVRDNILFGNAMNVTNYENLIEACALKSDLDILPARDLTEIGEKGINLSGGQRQRVSLARAVYFDSDIYLLDDPLSAVDSHVGKHIFEKVVGKHGLLKDKTRILVTHGIQWLPSVDTIVVMSNGVISEVGSYEELLDHDGDFADFLRTYLIEKETDNGEEEDEEVQEFKAMTMQRLVSIHSDSGASDTDFVGKRKHKRSNGDSESDLGLSLKKDGGHKPHDVQMHDKEKLTDQMDSAKLIEEEEVEIGNVRWEVFMTYARAVGLKSALMIFLLYASYQTCALFASIWLTEWTANTDLQNLTAYPADSQWRRNKNDYYLGVYGSLGVAQGILVLSYSCVAILRMLKAAQILHHKMLINILRGPMSFFDTTPVGRIVNRFSQDVDAVDSEIPMQMEAFLDCLLIVLSTLIVISYSTPIFMSVLLPVIIIYMFVQRFYVPTSRQLRRLDSKSRSPIYNNFSESLTGSSVIRAFNVQERFAKESERRVDYNQEYVFASNTVNRWLGFRLEVLGGVIVLAAAIFSVLERENINGSLAGLSVSYALQITDNLNWLVRTISDMETNIVSVERVNQYTATPTEAPLRTGYIPKQGWPDRGQVEMKSFSLRYREGLDLVLKDINISINPGEKIGIVGRTGAGKSSMTLSLFRLIEAASGKIIIDGEDVGHLGLYDLRSRLTILPQEPVLFSGSLRMNLDPMGEHSDNAIWVALEHAHLKTFIEGLPAKLEYECGEGGQNLSVGQRQLICLARSLLRKSKILILDEATAAVDLETDDLIQNTISSEFTSCTVLTIAHRLNTVIDYDRILVLSEGQVKEFDTPEELLLKTDSIFYGMAKDAGLV